MGGRTMNKSVNDHTDSHCIAKCTSPPIDTISLRAIRVLSVVVLLIGIVSIATQVHKTLNGKINLMCIQIVSNG